MSNSLALIKDMSSLRKIVRFMSRNNNSKGTKNSHYSIDSRFTEKLRPLQKPFSSPSVSSYVEKLKITLWDYDYH